MKKPICMKCKHFIHKLMLNGYDGYCEVLEGFVTLSTGCSEFSEGRNKIYKKAPTIDAVDLIRREDAIEAVVCHIWHAPDETRKLFNCENYVRDVVEEALKELPSVDRPQGEWVEMGTNADGTHNIKCDQCGEGFKTRGHARSHNTKNKYKFCPNCGAKMEREEE